jgi:hypothetical protein
VLGGPIAAVLHERTQSWLPVFAVVITMIFLTAIPAQFVLKPMGQRWLEQAAVEGTADGLVALPAS